MKKINLPSLWILLSLIIPVIFVTSCKDDDQPDPEPAKEIIIKVGANSADSAQLAFIDVEEEYTIIFEEGVFDFTNTLSMDGKSNVVIRGAGRDKTFLDFTGQTSGGEGVLITNSSSIRVENLTVRDTKGDALKAKDCNKISFVNVGTVWSGDPGTDNGAYGLYPVLCTEVFIDNCYAYGASDAGIYVGQSDQVIVKNCLAEGNVAGIEIENTKNADVFDNEATDNTGGILVFDLPGLTQNGTSTRVFNNNIHNNNRVNFAPAGNIVASVPNGTGCMILSTKNVEFFDNTISENQFAGILISNYLFINSMPNDPAYDPFPAGIFITNNTHAMTAGAVNVADQPAEIQQIIGLLGQYGLDQPNILTDGLLTSPDDVCIQEGSASFVNINAGDPTFMSVTADVSAHDCTKTRLPEITFDPF